MTPTQRTLAHLKKQGYKCAIVEKFNRFAGPHGIRQDLFGIIDILCLTPEGVLGVQSTGQDFSGHQSKILKEKQQESKEWLSCPGTKLVLYSWKKKDRDKRGGWELRIREFTLQDFEGYNISFT